PHIFRYQDLNLARLPVPPRPPGHGKAASITAPGARARRSGFRSKAGDAMVAGRRGKLAMALIDPAEVADPTGKADWSEPEKWAWGEIAAGRIADFAARDGALDPTTDK